MSECQSLYETLQAENGSKSDNCCSLLCIYEKMLFNGNRCFSPISCEDDTSFDGMLVLSSECNETRSMQSDGGISIDSDSQTMTSGPSSGKGRKQSQRKGRRSSPAEEANRTKHPSTVGRRNERERNRVKQVK